VVLIGITSKFHDNHLLTHFSRSLSDCRISYSIYINAQLTQILFGFQLLPGK